MTTIADLIKILESEKDKTGQVYGQVAVSFKDYGGVIWERYEGTIHNKVFDVETRLISRELENDDED